MESVLKTTETKAQYKKQQSENKLNSWENKSLHGQHLRNIDGKHDHTVTAKNIGTPAILSENATILSENCCSCKCFDTHMFISLICV